MLADFLRRIGTFLILIGIGLLVLFVASEGTGAADFDYLFWSLIAIVVGWFLRGRRAPSEPARRFSLLRRLWGRQRNGKEQG